MIDRAGGGQEVGAKLLAPSGRVFEAWRKFAVVALDNEAAERALRHGVIWRKTSGGTDSERGSRFVGQILSVVAPCQQRGRDVLGSLTECFHLHFAGQPAPSLLSPS